MRQSGGCSRRRPQPTAHHLTVADPVAIFGKFGRHASHGFSQGKALIGCQRCQWCKECADKEHHDSCGKRRERLSFHTQPHLCWCRWCSGPGGRVEVTQDVVGHNSPVESLGSRCDRMRRGTHQLSADIQVRAHEYRPGYCRAYSPDSNGWGRRHTHRRGPTPGSSHSSRICLR